MDEPFQVERRPAWFGEGAQSFFGWYHDAPAAPARDCVAVLCSPIGHEYTRSHRSLRHLADRLARAGVPTLRFDYHGIGDSPGTDLDPGRLACWLANIRTAVERARSLSGRARVCLAGVRLGATLAAIATSELDVDLLVLWNPVLKGKPYLRELQAIAMMAARSGTQADGVLEAAGFVMSAETIAAIKSVDLLSHELRVAGRVLILSRDDQALDLALSRRLEALGIPHDQERVPGWGGMMADHQFTVVPDEALERLVEWVAAHSGAAAARPPAAAAPGPQALALPVEDDKGKPVTVEEQLCRFGPGGHLFGVLTRRSASPDRPAVLMFNAGSVHHVGPNRVYVTLARSLAALGFACLRMDLEGLGDSVLRGPGRENHPYPETATADARAAVEFLKSQHGYQRFIALGLCSGAHTAFHMGLTLEQHEVGELIMINPFTFYWREGMSLALADDLYDMHAYRQSMRDPARWMKLLRGDVNIKRLLQVAFNHPRRLARTYYDAFCEAVMPHRGPRLSQDLRRLFAMKRHVTMLVAEGDPGQQLLMSGAKRTAAQGIREGHIRLEVIPGGDHTFSRLSTREDLVRRLGWHLRQRLTPRAPARAD